MTLSEYIEKEIWDAVDIHIYGEKIENLCESDIENIKFIKQFVYNLWEMKKLLESD
jgi:hypothetical protein